jgi:hypothetical protein
MIVIISVSFDGWYDIVSDLPGDAIRLVAQTYKVLETL